MGASLRKQLSPDHRALLSGWENNYEMKAIEVEQESDCDLFTKPIPNKEERQSPEIGLRNPALLDFR